MGEIDILANAISLVAKQIVILHEAKMANVNEENEQDVKSEKNGFNFYNTVNVFLNVHINATILQCNVKIR